jgi:hypothetical protein
MKRNIKINEKYIETFSNEKIGYTYLKVLLVNGDVRLTLDIYFILNKVFYYNRKSHDIL